VEKVKNSCLSIKRKDTVIATLLLFTITIGIIANMVSSGLTYGESGTEIVILNPLTGDGDFIYSAENGTVGTRFNATAWIYNVSNMFAFQVRLYVDDSLLNITNAWLPTWDSNYIFAGQTTIQPTPAFYDEDSDGIIESVLVGDSLLFGDPVTGNGLLAIIELEIIYTPSTGSVSCNLNINNEDTYALDSELNIIPTLKTSGYYEYIGAPAPPQADFTYSPLNPLIDETVTFDASSSTPNGGSIIAYLWDFGDGSPLLNTTDPIVTHIYTVAGDYTVTLTVFDDQGLNDTTSKTITVSKAPQIPKLKVEPSTYVVTQEGQIFNISITIADLSSSLRAIGAQFRLVYDSTYLQVLNAFEGPFFPLFPQRPDPPYTVFVWYDEVDDPIYGSHVLVLDILYPNDTGDWPGPFPEGDGVITTITFNVSTGFMGKLPLNFYIADNETVLVNDTPDYIPVQVTNGTVYSYYNVTITEQPKSTYIHGESVYMKFTIQYWDGSYYTTDNFNSIRVKVFNGTDFIDEILLDSEDFNPTTNEWTVEFVPWDTPLGAYQLAIKAYDIVDSAGVSGPMVDVWSSSFNITEIPTLGYETLNVELDVGSIHFPGETAEFYILTSLMGMPINVRTITAMLYYGNQQLDLTADIENIAMGVYRILYTLPITIDAGTYTLVIEANYTNPYIKAYGSGIASFQVSSTLNGWGDLLADIEDEIITIIIPNLAEIKANLTDIKATVVSINGTVATINTTMGYVYAYATDINATISGLIVNSKGEILAKIETALGNVTATLKEIDGKITKIDGSTATIETTVGEIKVSLDTIKDLTSGAKGAAEGAASTSSTTLYATSTLSVIAIIIGILILLILRKE
jgi:PKD repeat protein